MFSFGKYSYCYEGSLKVVNLYDILIDIIINKNSSINDFNYFVNELRKAILEEDKLYNNLSLDDIKEFIVKLKIITSDEGILFSDIRINNRLSFINDKLLNYTIKNEELISVIDIDEDLSLLDLVNSKIAIDTYKLINHKLTSLSLNDKKSLEYAKKINILNIEHVIYNMSLYVLSEKIMINSKFNFSKLPTIDLNVIEERIYEDKGIKINLIEFINSKIYDDVISLINKFSELSLDSNNYENIYNNLVYTAQFEILFEYLNKEQLESISSYFDNIYNNNPFVVGNIKKLIKNKIS